MIHKEINIIRDNLSLLTTINSSLFGKWRDKQADEFEKKCIQPAIYELNSFLSEATVLSNSLARTNNRLYEITSKARSVMGDLLDGV